MPKTDIDYSNTIIYKITCKDSEIKDVYVGHTTNFVQRKHSHKQCCNNPNSSSYDCKLYSTIREKGGWNNWTMEIINFFNCYDHYEARQKEQEYFLSLNATLNSIEPMPKPKPKPATKPLKETYFCQICNVGFDCTKPFELHNETNKHKKRSCNKQTDVIEGQIIEIKPNTQFSKIFTCTNCSFKCCKKRDYDRHILTSKHQKMINGKPTGLLEETPPAFICKCTKPFHTHGGLWKHKTKCISILSEYENQIITSELKNNDLITYLINENKELKSMIMEVCKSHSK